jgi:hypothetical protein
MVLACAHTFMHLAAPIVATRCALLMCRLLQLDKEFMVYCRCTTKRKAQRHTLLATSPPRPPFGCPVRVSFSWGVHGLLLSRTAGRLAAALRRLYVHEPVDVCVPIEVATLPATPLMAYQQYVSRPFVVIENALATHPTHLIYFRLHYGSKHFGSIFF